MAWRRRRIRIRDLAIAAALSAVAAPASGQSSDSVEEETICVGSAIVWGGLIEDVRNIESVPVPESFRRRFEAGGCTRFQLVKGSLLNWHLAFGNERTATAALAYVEDRLTAGRPSPRGFRDELSRIWRDALRTIESTRLPAAYGPDRSAATRRLQRNRSVARAAELIEAHDDFIELTQQYLRAAEYYESAALLAKAETYWPAVQAGLDILFRGAPIANADFDAGTDNQLEPSTHRINQIHDLDMRLAILRARLSRNPADIDAATVVMRRNFDPVLATAEQNAEQHSGEICEFDGEARDEEMRALERACDAENSLAVRIVNFWRNRAHLDLLMAADPAHYVPRREQRREDGSSFARRTTASVDGQSLGWIDSFETAEQLLADGPSRGMHDRWEELPLLLLARADLHARLAQAHRGSSQRYAAGDQTEMALDHLAEAEQVTPAHRHPALYRRIAISYLRLWDAPARGEDESWRESTDRIWLAALLRHALASLESIALGADETRH
jgi:hypothetical protein